MLADAIAATLPELRREAEARMTSRAAVMRSTGRLEQDEESGLEVPEWATIVADSPFRLRGTRGGTSASRTQTIGGVEVTLAVREGHFPAGTTLRDGDLIEVTSGENAGTVWRVVEGDDADQQTAYRVPIVATDRPEEWA
jgi:hypothetical protein